MFVLSFHVIAPCPYTRDPADPRYFKSISYPDAVQYCKPGLAFFEAPCTCLVVGEGRYDLVKELHLRRAFIIPLSTSNRQHLIRLRDTPVASF